MEDVKVGSVVKGIVTGIENYGIFVKIDENYSGMIHISEISDRFVKDVKKYADVGEEIYVEILTINVDGKKCTLSIKDINYRKNDASKIKESIRGFGPLKRHLPIWIEEKYKEIHS